MAEAIPERRAEAVAATLAGVRDVERKKGVSRQSLAEIEALLVALASRTELFPPAHFPIGGGGSHLYRLAEDAGLGLSLYASGGAPGARQPPHDHTTWAVIAGIFGDEHNVIYERTDDRGAPGRGTLKKVREVTVRRGSAVSLMPEDFHTIATLGDAPKLHLHLYGHSLEDLPGRIFFENEQGGACKVFPASPSIRNPQVPAGEVKAMLRDGRELALIDVREEGVFATGHMLFVSSLPLSRLELGIAALVPRRATRIVAVDGGEGLAERAARKLLHFGYTCVSVMDGGVEAWAKAGHELFTGVNVPSKAFGEFVEHVCRTPSVSAAELKAMTDRGDNLVILDSRPFHEHRAMCIPGGIDVPGAELVLRVHDLAPDPGTTVVVHCTGRTRSIIGAQSLIDAGVPNRVVALRNGTMGWHLAGCELDRGQDRRAPEPSAGGLAKAKAAAARVAARAGVRSIDHAALARLRAEADRRSLYLLDVRSPEEFAAGHLPGSRSAPGGQLVQATDVYVGTRGARLVLIDGEGVRAPMTASWLVQMGWDETYVLERALDGQPLEKGPATVFVPGLDRIQAETVGAAELKGLLDRKEAVVVDLATSEAYRAGHIPGAWFAVRSRFADDLPKVPWADALALASPDGVLARLAAPEAAKLTESRVLVLDGGTEAWRSAGLPLTAGHENMASATDDAWLRPFDYASGAEDAMRDYLAWEVSLPERVAREGDCRFRRPPPA
jgi:rhodanese-related sulfurtransferase/predicted metal-dependent enzyme (double-stranded beta helix superfamily)